MLIYPAPGHQTRNTPDRLPQPLDSSPTRSLTVFIRATISAMLCVLAVGYLFTGSTRETSATVRATASHLRHTPIEEIRLGQRVVGVNPLRHQTHAESNITPATWRTVDLVTDFHGVDYEFSLLRPQEWIDAKHAIVGGDIQLDIEELGISGAATVTSIGPCPEIELDRPNQRRNVVTGLIRHPADNLLYLSVAGEAEPIGATTLHPFWSEDRHCFVAAGELLTGERFRTVTGGTARLTSVIHHSGPAEMVYNLEVDAEHVFCVGNSGLLSHNAKECVDLNTLPKEGIYVFMSKDGLRYVGQSGDMIRRIREHMANGFLRTEDLHTLKTTAVEGGKLMREIAEQLRIRALGGIDNLRNMRNPIGPRRLHLLPETPGQ